MSILTEASLIVTPNAYKAGTLLSVVPSSGAGDMVVARNSGATRVNSAGLIEDVAVNVPRIDYTNGSCPSLLVEPQRTNLALYSEEFDNASWVKSSSFITPNTEISPNGTTSADTYLANQSDDFYQVVAVSTNTTYTISLWVKLGTATNLCLIVNNQAAWNTIGGQSFNSSNGLNTTTWTRVSYTFTTPSTLPFGGVNFHIGGNAETGLTQSSGTIFIYGAQLEQGSYPTSYIPTTSASVTRVADVVSKTGISDLIGQTEGTIYFDGIVNNIQNSSTNILNTNKTPSTSSQIALTKVKANNKIRFEHFLGSGTFENITLNSTNTFANGTRTKVAIRYKSGNFAMYVNGILEAISSSTFTNIGTKSELFLNDSQTYYAYQESISFNSVVLWKTTLTNTQLAQLTTL